MVLETFPVGRGRQVLVAWLSPMLRAHERHVFRKNRDDSVKEYCTLQVSQYLLNSFSR